jgi:hypothetical protein
VLLVGLEMHVPHSPAMAQPEPTFRTTCGELRNAIGRLIPKDDRLVTIEVEGQITRIHAADGLVYMTMCSAPDPRVMCVTYEIGNRMAGEVVVFSGSYAAQGPDHLLLDPCLHHLPDDPEKR